MAEDEGVGGRIPCPRRVEKVPVSHCRELGSERTGSPSWVLGGAEILNEAGDAESVLMSS